MTVTTGVWCSDCGADLDQVTRQGHTDRCKTAEALALLAEPGPPCPAGDLYPQRDEVLYGRAVWPMGEDGDDGLMVEGHDRRAWAALNRWLRVDAGERLAEHPERPAVRLEWCTFTDTCGCTTEQHADHVRRIEEADEVDEAGLSITDEPGPYMCSDITDNTDCSGLAPCAEDTFAWTSTMHRDPAIRPADAAPVLVWSRR